MCNCSCLLARVKAVQLLLPVVSLTSLRFVYSRVRETLICKLITFEALSVVVVCTLKLCVAVDTSGDKKSLATGLEKGSFQSDFKHAAVQGWAELWSITRGERRGAEFIL